MTDVFILETSSGYGGYEIVDVFSTLEGAMQARPYVVDWHKLKPAYAETYTGTYRDFRYYITKRTVLDNKRDSV